MSKRSKQPLITVGWKEWCALPDLGVPAVKAKVDTGAKTSAIHAEKITPFEKDGQRWVRFTLWPVQGNKNIIRECEAPVLDVRGITSSSGHSEDRYIIMTTLEISGQSWPIELSLTTRDTLRLRMLLGREAMHRRLLVDPSHEYCVQKMVPSKLAGLYGMPGK